jgi:hypothetical protein
MTSHMPAPTASDLQRAQRLLPACLATCMSAFVAAVVTAINTGLDPGLPARWLHAWLRAWPAAVAAAYLFRPVAWWAAQRLARITRTPVPDPEST